MRTEATGSSPVLVLLALIAAAIAVYCGVVGARLIYLAMTFGKDVPLEQGPPMIFGLLSYISVLTAAVVVPFIAVAAAAIAWLCWKTGTSRLAA
ncbi:MAG TPA: hypothetical protein VGH50_15165 [Candidatus Binatia bacterium]|jgi:hypothetical protein